MTFLLTLAQNESILFRNDQIFTVLAVALIIFVGLVLYLVLMDRKVRKLEDKVKDLDSKQSQPIGVSEEER